MKSRVAIVVSRLMGIAQLLGGIFLLLIFGVCTIIYFTDVDFQSGVGTGFLIFCLIMDFIAVMLILASRRTKKLIEEFKKYVAILSVKRTATIDELAATIGVSEQAVKKNIELMIKRNYFVNAYINHESNSIVIGNAANIDINQSLNNIEHNECKCKNCGAMNKVLKGASANCDYCGTLIKG